MTDKRKDEILNQGDDVVERLKDAANRMLDGDIIGHNLSVFATDILTIINRADLSPPLPDDVAEAIHTVNSYDRKSVEFTRALETLINKASTPSAEVEYWKDKCYTAESDAEIHAQCHDKVFDEKKALEAEVRGLRDCIQAWRDHLSGYKAITTDIDLGIAVDVVITGMDEALNHTGGK